MTAQHPQTLVEQAMKMFRDNDARLHTPPVFAPTLNQVELAAQAEEMRRWQLQEQYGKPLRSSWYKVALFWAWGLLALGGFFFFSVMLRGFNPYSDCIPEDSVCAEVATNLHNEVVSSVTIYALMTLVFFAGFLALAAFMKKASTEEGYYGSSAVRSGTKVLRGIGTFIAVFWVLNKLNPPSHQHHSSAGL
jgi:hypothetical protein